MPLQPSLLALSRRGLLATVGVSILSCRNVADGVDGPGKADGDLAWGDIEPLRQAPEPPATGITLETYPEAGASTLTEDGSTPAWRVASSDHADSGIQALVGNTYTDLLDLSADIAAAQDAAGGLGVTVFLPDHACKVISDNRFSVSGRGTLALVAPLRADGTPQWQFKPLRQYPIFALGIGDDTDPALWQNTHGHVQGIRMGVFDDEEPVDPSADAQVGDMGVYHGSGGTIVVRDCVIVGFAQDGIESVSSPIFKPYYGQILVYDSELYWNGSTALKHNVYVHDLAEFRFVRSLSYRPKAGHSLKLETADYRIIDSFISNISPKHAWGPGYSDPINYTRSSKGIIVNSLLEVQEQSGNGRPRQAIGDAARKESWGGYSKRTPAPFTLTTNIAEKGSLITWNKGGVNHCTHWAGQNNQIIGEGETTFFLRRFTTMGYQFPGSAKYPGTTRLPLDENLKYDIRIENATGEYIDFIGADVQSQSGDTVTFDVSGASPSSVPSPGLEKFGIGAVKINGTDWDTPVLNPKVWNRNDPDYHWGLVGDGAGGVDHSQGNKLDQLFVTDSLILLGNGARQALFRLRGTFSMFTGEDGMANTMAMAPMNRPQGATAEWPDVAGAAEWGDILHINSEGEKILGVEGSVVDQVDLYPTYLRDVAVRSISAQMPDSTNVFTVLKVAYGANYGPDPIVSMLDASGVRHDQAPDVAGSINAAPLVSGAHIAGGTDLTVDNATGVSTGDRLHVRFAPRRGAVAMQATTVDAVAGNTITLADPLARDLTGGEEVAVFTPAGAKPAWWNDGVS